MQQTKSNEIDCGFYPFGKTEAKAVPQGDGTFYPAFDDNGVVLDPDPASPEPALTVAPSLTADPVETSDAAESPTPEEKIDLTQRRRDAEKKKNDRVAH